jgi:hypothetical protein
MSVSCFESFCRVIDGLPPKAVIKTAELECQMLEDDLAHERDQINLQEVILLLAFCHFIKTSALLARMLPMDLPNRHVARYRSIVEKLIEARELPFKAKAQFDSIFCTGFLNALTV